MGKLEAGGRSAELVLTSLVRKHVGYRLWRAIHWFAYASVAGQPCPLGPDWARIAGSRSACSRRSTRRDRPSPTLVP
jgi:hypothetical protein